MSITTKDLAKACGVSRTTVTRALSGTGRISEETKNRILNMAKELDYQPDLLARSLVKGRSMTIGVVLCDLKNMFFPSIIDAMERVARDNGYLLNITLHDNSKILEENIITQLAGHKIDGLLLDPASREKAHYDYLKKLPFPVVIIGGDRLEDLSFVGNNEFEAADSAARFIAAKGYHSLHFVFPGFEGKEADFYGGMTYDYIARHGVDAIVKGLRDGADFAYECQIAQFNRQHAPQADTLFLLADPQRQALSSSWVKRAYVAGEEIRDAVPPVVLAMLAKKLPINKTKESEDRGMEHGRKCN